MIKILFIDDDCETFREDFNNLFHNQNIEITFCDSKDNGINAISSGKEYDIILLDWYLEHDNSLLSQQVLNYLRNNYFVPVLIWSYHVADFEATEIDYPLNLIGGISKDEFTPENVNSKIKTWLDNSSSAKISNIYRKAIRVSVEQVFFELSVLQDLDIATLLKHVIGTENNIDWSNDFILNLVHRKLIVNETFTSQFRSLLSSFPNIDANESTDQRRKIINLILYYAYGASVIRCGDIVKVERPNGAPKLGIVITPDCDLEWNKTRFLEVIEMKKFDDPGLLIDFNDERRINNIKSQNEESLYFFPAVLIDDEYVDLVAILKSKIILEEIPVRRNEKAYPKSLEKLKYSSRFNYNGTEAKLTFIGSNSNPYKSDFLHSLNTHVSRVGTPDITKIL